MAADTFLAQEPTNRLLNSLLLNAEDEAQFRVKRPGTSKLDIDALEIKRTHLIGVLDKYSKAKDVTDAEKKTRQFIRHELRKTDARLRPVSVRAVLNFLLDNLLVNSLVRRRGNFQAHQKIISITERNVIVKPNVVELLNTMREHGFNLNIEKTLTANVADNLKEFNVRYPHPGHSSVDYILNFKKHSESGVYYFNSFDAINRDSQARQRFGMRDTVKFSADEAANLVQLRPVAKRTGGEKVWHALDPFSPGTLKLSKLDIMQQLSELNIKEMKSPAKADKLVRDLEAGNKVTINVLNGRGETEEFHLSVSHNAKALIVHDSDGRFVPTDGFVTPRFAQAENLIKVSKQRKAATQIAKPRQRARSRA